MISIERCASTTSASVHARLARRLFRGETCKYRGLSDLWYNPAVGRQTHNCRAYSCMDPANTFLWTVIRKPEDRIISEFFHSSPNKHTATPEAIISHITAAAAADIYWKKLHGGKINKTKPIPTYVQKVLKRMNFIGLVERLVESLCVLGMLLNLDPSDVVFFDTRLQNRFILAKSKQKCYQNPKPFVPIQVQQLFQGEKWKQQTLFSRMLYDAANRSLDATIDSLGRDQFYLFRREFERLQDLAEDVCARDIKLPCSDQQKPQPKLSAKSCIHMNVGCGHKCLDHLFRHRETRWEAKNTTTKKWE